MNDSESARLAVLRQLNLLDTPPSESFDRIARMASQLFDLPIAAVSLTDRDRQWFKSRVGVDHWEIPRFKACCGEVTDTSAVLVVPDLLESDCYHDSALAESGIRFYAGAPLITREGYTLGAMCVLGTEPRTASDQEISSLEDLAAMVMTQIELQHSMGRIDPTTGLPNYNQFVEDMEDLGRDFPGAAYSVLSTELIDLSQSSFLQRVMGPTYLDDLSKAAARKLQQLLGVSPKLYQIGHCQFAHLETGAAETVLNRALDIQGQLLELKLGESSPFMLRPVVGIAPIRLGERTPADASRIAHSAGRDARQAELGASIYSADSDALHQRRFTLLSRFPGALGATDQLRLVYQPRVDMVTGKCLGAEALLRWRDASLGDISPAEFIPLIENTPIARDLTDWVMVNAIRQAAVWQRQGLSLRISFNIAAANLEEHDFTQRLLGYLDQEQLPLDAIELELTEGCLISNGLAAREQLNALMGAGLKIAIDDFGTGYSSLAYLQQIPAHVVKIDRSFITAVELQDRRKTLVRSMVRMAHELGYSVVAEGVETRDSYEFLKSLGCDEVQGYLISRPLETDKVEAWLSEWQHESSLTDSEALEL